MLRCALLLCLVTSVLRAEDEAAIGSTVQVKLGVELRLRGFSLPVAAPVGEPAALEALLRERLGDAEAAQAAAAGYRLGYAFTARKDPGDELALVTVFAAASGEAAQKLRDALLRAEAKTSERLVAEGGKLSGEEKQEIAPDGTDGGYALERTAVLPGQQAPSCLDKVVVSAGRWVIEVGHVAPLGRRNPNLRAVLARAALDVVLPR